MNIHELCLGREKRGGLASKIAENIFQIRDAYKQQSFNANNSEHRMEHIATISGVDWINDSRSTNVNSTWFALESMHKPVVLILGGVDKGNDYSVLEDVVKEKVTHIITIHQALQHAVKIRKMFKDIVESISDFNSLKDAVLCAYNNAANGSVVLLSPACASFDLFENYEDRGWQFKKEVRLI